MSFEDWSKSTAQLNAAKLGELLQTNSLSGVPYSNSVVAMSGYAKDVDTSLQYHPKYALLIQPVGVVSEAGLYLGDATEHLALEFDSPTDEDPEIVRYLEAREAIKRTFYKSLGMAALSEAAMARHTLQDAECYEWAGKLGLAAGIDITTLCRAICKIYDIPSAVAIEFESTSEEQKLAAIYYPVISSPSNALESVKAVTSSRAA